MVFSSRNLSGFREDRKNSYKIMSAFSNDKEEWIRRDDPSLVHSDTGWDSEMVAYPCVFKLDEDFYMLYNGNCFGASGFGYAKLKS